MTDRKRHKTRINLNFVELLKRCADTPLSLIPTQPKKRDKKKKRTNE